MTKITDFRLKMRPVFSQLNRTGRAYDVIGHQKYGCSLSNIINDKQTRDPSVDGNRRLRQPVPIYCLRFKTG